MLPALNAARTTSVGGDATLKVHRNRSTIKLEPRRPAFADQLVGRVVVLAPLRHVDNRHVRSLDILRRSVGGVEKKGERP